MGKEVLRHISEGGGAHGVPVGTPLRRWKCAEMMEAKMQSGALISC